MAPALCQKSIKMFELMPKIYNEELLESNLNEYLFIPYNTHKGIRYNL